MSKSNQDVRPSVTIRESVTMDSRKFLSVFNNSAESQIAFFTEAVEKLGNEQGKNWRLACTTNGRIFIEDVSSSDYLVADFSRQKGGRIAINNLRKVEITEGEKSPHFEGAVEALVESIQKNDVKGVEGAYGRIVASRFRSKAVPNSGLVRTRDGQVRHISVRSDVMSEAVQDQLVDTIVKELSDQITLNEGEVSGVFNKEPFVLPVSPLMERRVVAYHMRERAKNAYWHSSFQTLTESVAAQVCKGPDGIRQVLPAVAAFFQENQEFNLLDRNQMEDVVGNALAAKGVFNESLVKNTASLLYKTGLKVNRADIIDAWRKTAKCADHPVMLENVAELDKTSEKQFPEIYDKFLGTVFMTEAVGDTTRQGLSNGLAMLKDRISDPQAQQQIDELTTRLQNPSTADDQSVWDAMNLMAKTNQRVNAMESFDTMPGADALGGDPEAGAVPEVAPSPEITPPAGGATGTPTTVININTGGGGAPSITNTPPVPEAAPPSEDLAGALDDIGLETGGEQEPPAPGQAPAGQEAEEPRLDLAGLERAGSPLNEEDQSLLDVAMDWIHQNVQDAPSGSEDDGSVQEDVDSDDLFVLPEGLVGGQIDHDYGVPVLREFVLKQRMMDVDKLAREKNLKPEELTEHLDEIAGAVLAGDPQLKDPKQMQKAKEELVGAYASQKAQSARQTVAPVSENQHRSPTMQLSRRGLKKAAVNKLVTENKLTWLKKEENAVLGQYKGINFVIDKADPPVLLNHDGSLEVPIPEGLVPGALYLAEMVDVAADADPFVEWLDANIEQLRPLTEAEEKLVQEAVAKLTVSPGTKIEVEVDPTMGDVQEPIGAEATPVISEPDPMPLPPEGETPEVPEVPSDGAAPAGAEGGEDTEADDLEDLDGLDEALQQVFNGMTLTEDTCKACKKDPCVCDDDCPKCKSKPCKCE